MKKMHLIYDIKKYCISKFLLCSTILIVVGFSNISFGQEIKPTTVKQKEEISITFGLHYNGYFNSKNNDTCINGIGSCIDLSSMGIEKNSPVFGLDFGINYKYPINNKLSLIPKLSYSNRKIKFEVDSLSLIENPNNYPLKYQQVLNHDISNNCIDIGLYFEYLFFKNRFSFSGGVKYTFITILKKNFTHFNQEKSSEMSTHFFSKRFYRQFFPHTSISSFHPSVLVTYNCNNKQGETIFRPFLGVEMENYNFYYFQFGIEVPIGLKKHKQ